ncbi:M23 family metallopeptidase, partial [Erysipelotrichaceae bacterium OttesenSCG-928-M19]|nr:M23 family metallopeptidase [Erysipelotrichaceae bacterium OttesenSCG-928-M19]
MHRKFLFVLLLLFCLTLNVSAKESCKVNNATKICTETKGQYYYENTYVYQNSSLKKYKEITKIKKSKDKKIVFSSLTKTYSSKGVFVKSYYFLKDKNGSLIKDIAIKAHSNGKESQNVEKRYTKNKVTYVLVKKYTKKSYLNYYLLTDTSKDKRVVKKAFNKKGKVLNIKTYYYNKDNKLLKYLKEDRYSSGRKKQVQQKNYSEGILSLTINKYYKNTKKNKLYSVKEYKYDSKGCKTRRLIKYYNKQYRYHGFKETKYNTNNKQIISEYKKMYYVGTKLLASKTDYTYENNKLINATTNYYNYLGTRYQLNVKKYNSNNKLTSNLTSKYSNKMITLQTGYTYQGSTYAYLHREYLNGKVKLYDKTTYKNNTITKTNYYRAYYDNNGLLTNDEEYEYSNGEIVKQRKDDISAKAVTKSYPVAKGVITSPSWHYAASFGGGWHPGIDVATYKVSKYGYAQPIKVFSDATVIKRSNLCKTTKSYGCSGGFGNYVVVAMEYQGKYYTIIYAHQTKLNSKTASHKKIIDQDKKGYKKNDIIGYVGSSGNSTGYHIHVQVQEHRYAKSIDDIKKRYKATNSPLFGVNYNLLGNNKDIFVVNPDILFNLKYY